MKAHKSVETIEKYQTRLVSGKRQVLLMSCKILVKPSDCHAIVAQALLDSMSSASFVSEWLENTFAFHTNKNPREHPALAEVQCMQQWGSKSLLRFMVTGFACKARTLNGVAILLPKARLTYLHSLFHLKTSGTIELNKTQMKRLIQSFNAAIKGSVLPLNTYIRAPSLLQ